MRIKKYTVTVFCLLISVLAFAQDPKDFVIPVKVVVNNQQPRISFTWPVNSNAASYTIKRKIVTDESYNSAFDTIAKLTLHADTITTFMDTGILSGVLYEYEISGSFPLIVPAERNNYLCAGINITPVHQRGTIILLCDNTIVAALETELHRLYEDLVGDGWKVKRIDVDRSSNHADAAGVRNKIIAAYNENPDTKELFIIGHVPVPYSGGINPDGHFYHYGAWPADGYYGDMINNNWSDTSNFEYNQITDKANINISNDGKFDQNNFTSVQLGVGRIDFADMPAFETDETGLLKRYLAKDHLFRQGAVSVKKRGLIEDNLLGYSEKFSQSAWKSFSSLAGFDKIKFIDWETELLLPDGYLWSFGAGSGTSTSCSGIATTTDFVTHAYNTVFTELFGSWFGDWNFQNNLMRAAIASPGKILTCVWGGRPHWYFHHMAAGYPIGYSALLTVNNSGKYSNTGNCSKMVHISLIGDPSLRSSYIQPASNISAAVNKTSVDITWSAAPQANISGYNIYRGNSVTNEFVLLNNTPLTATSFSDNTPSSGNNVYMVRTVMADTFVAAGVYLNNSTYYNLSQGAFDSVVFSNIVLPVKLESFTVKLNRCTAQLDWKAAATNSKAYTIEYSNNGSDFKTVGTVNAANNVSAVYSFVHTPATGKAFYRLKMIDADGKYEYSKVIALPVNCSKNAVLVYPNPVNDILNINVSLVNNASSNTATLHDASGKLLYTKQLLNGSNSIDMSNLAKGIYHLKLFIDETPQNFKIQK